MKFLKKTSLQTCLRAAAMALTACALLWGVASGSTLWAAMIAAVVGVLLGERIAQTPLRSLVLVAGTFVLLIIFWGSTSFLLNSRFFPVLVGPLTALHYAGIVRYGSLFLLATALLRALALRRPALLALELAAVVGSLSFLFAAHRDGVIARPFWIADWAWRKGIDPSQIFLGIGGVAALLLLFLLFGEYRQQQPEQRPSRLAVLLPLLLALVLFWVPQERWMPKPQVESGLGLQPQESAQNGTPKEVKPDNEGKDKIEVSQGEGQTLPASPSQPANGEKQENGEGRPTNNRGSGNGNGNGQDQSPKPNDQPDLNDQSEEQSESGPTPVAVVLLGDDYQSPSQAYYFRQEAWSSFVGTRLGPTTRSDVDRDIPEGFPTKDSTVKEPPIPSTRKLVRGTVGMLVEHTRPFALESVQSLSPRKNPNPARFVKMYQFESLAQNVDYDSMFGREAGDPSWSKEVRDYYLTLPEDKRYQELAKSLLADLPAHLRNDPFAKAIKIKLYLDQFTYSTKEKHANVPDPTADFLFGNKIGYCVHFAHAAVFLWRAAGIPARIGTGYHAEEDKRQGSVLLLQGGDAHAWPELYLQGVGWVILDISPATNLDPAGSPTDQELQQLLGDMARAEPLDEEKPQEEKTERNYGRLLRFGALWLFALASAALVATKVWRRIAWRFVPSLQLPRVGYRAALDLLSEAGLVRDHGETREHFASRTQLAAFVKLTALHLEGQLGNRQDGAPMDRRIWRTELRALERELAGKTKRWRRWLGRLSPVSFLQSR